MPSRSHSPLEPEVAEHWAKLIEAAEAGDERAKEFLELFGPWARERLKDWPRQ